MQSDICVTELLLRMMYTPGENVAPPSGERTVIESYTPGCSVGEVSSVVSGVISGENNGFKSAESEPSTPETSEFACAVGSAMRTACDGDRTVVVTEAPALAVEGVDKLARGSG